MRGRFWASTAAFTALFATSFGACDPGFTIDPAGYCLDEPQDPRCPPPSAGTGGSGGTGGSFQGNAGTAPSGSSGSGGVGGSGSAGAPPTCTAPQIDCSGTCVDITQDNAQNCGACGYACEAGRACTGGTCSPLPIVDGVVAPYALAVDASFVYFTVPALNASGGALPVQRVPRDGGAAAAVPFLGGPAFRARSLVLIESTLYFGDLGSGKILQGSVSGGSVTEHPSGSQPAVQQLLASGDTLLWNLFDGGNSRMRRTPPGNGGAGGASGAGGANGAGGTGAGGFEELAFQSGRIAAVSSTDAAVAFWINRDTSPALNSGLWRKTDGVAPEKLLPGDGMVALAVGSDEAFVADAVGGIGKVQAAAAAKAPAPRTNVIGPSDVGGVLQGLAVTPSNLYWLAVTAGGQLELHRAARDGTDARVLGRVQTKQPAYWAAPVGPLGPSQLLIDSGFVYFADPGTLEGDVLDDNLSGVKGEPDGAIYRLPQ